ncbi:MAG TPA: hypothetical protein VGC08_11760 [Pedobacter sp.]
MKILTLAQANELLKNATTPELQEALIKALLTALETYESQPDPASGITALNLKIESLSLELKKAILERDQAREIADDAMEQVNALAALTPSEKIVTVDKKKYKVLFGVDGLSKDELAKDTAKLKILIAKKSGALELQEDK